MNTPVNFEIAKLLKEKGFDEFCSHAYKEFESPVLYIHQDKKYNNSFKKEWQNTIRKNSTMDNALIKRYSAPTISEVVMWLYEKHGLWLEVYMDDDTTFGYLISKITVVGRINYPVERGFDSPTEAYESAIKYTLKKLL